MIMIKTKFFLNKKQIRKPGKHPCYPKLTICYSSHFETVNWMDGSMCFQRENIFNYNYIISLAAEAKKTQSLIYASSVFQVVVIQFMDN